MHLYAVFSGQGVNYLLVLIKRPVAFSGYHKPVVFRKAPKCLKEYVQALVFPYKAKEKKVFGSLAFPFKPLPKMRI